MIPIGTRTLTPSGPGFTLAGAPRPASPSRSAQAYPTSDAPQPAQPPSTDAVVAAAKQIESFLRRTDSSLEFQVDSATGQTVVTVRNTATGEVVRQIPSEEVLRIAQRMDAEKSTVLNLHV